MLPFGRMLSYGNIAPVPVIDFKKNLQLEYNNVMYLSEHGDLYGYGWNNFGQLGLGDNTSRTSFVVLHTDVIAYWTGVHGAFLITSTGRIKFSGTTTAFPQIGNSVLSWVDVTDIFGALNIKHTDIKEISISESVRVLLHDGRLFACGRNYYGECGNGTNQTISTLSEMPINSIDSIFCSYFGTHMLKGSDAYFFGTTSNGTGGTGDAIGTIILTPKLTLSNVGHISALYDITWWFSNGRVYWSGLNTQYQAGNGSSTSTPAISPTLNPAVGINVSDYDTLQAPSSIGNSSIGSPIVSYTNYVRLSGRNDYGQCGNGSTAYVPNLYLMPISVLGTWDNVKYVYRSNSISAIITKDGKLYMCGGYGVTPLPDGTTSVKALKLMANMPWY